MPKNLEDNRASGVAIAFAISFLLICTLYTSPASADALEDGRAAVKAGDYDTALHILMPLAQKGNPVAQNMVGGLYMKGWGVAQDYAEAIKWFRNAAERGEPKAAWNLGLMYEQGLGVVQSCAEAVRWYRKPAERGNPRGQVNLGHLYDVGTKCIAEDPKEAVIWYRKAAMQGDPLGQADLGAMYATGRGVARDYTEAVSWYRKAAAQDNAQAQFRLGAMYEIGEGVAQNHDEALKYYRMAAKQGHPRAMERVGALAGTSKQDKEIFKNKIDFLVADCMKQGESEKACGCFINLAEQVFGPKFVEALYFQSMGDVDSFVKRLMEIKAEDPKYDQHMTELKVRAKERCGA